MPWEDGFGKLGCMQREIYITDLSDTEWNILEPLLPPPNKLGRPRKHP
jgi:hypothetical protein